MSEITKITVLFWASGLVLIAGLLLLNFSLPVALLVAGAMGIAASLGWFMLHLREHP